MVVQDADNAKAAIPRAVDLVSSRDHDRAMSEVGIADLKAHLSEHLRMVRRGRTITVLDRSEPIARIIPYQSPAPLEVRTATRPPSDRTLPPAFVSSTDSLSILLGDRRAR